MSVKDPNPLNRPEVYSFSSSSTTVDAISFSNVPGFGYRREFIYNSAYDLLQGYKMRSVEPALTISKNTSTSPMTLLSSVVNHVNDATWAGGASGTWLCTSLSGSQKSELSGNEILTFWEIKASFSYREQGWQLVVKDVGLNRRVYNGNIFLRKESCIVFDSDGNEKAATTPQPLNPDGTQRLNSSVISELTYDIYKPASFSSYFVGPT